MGRLAYILIGMLILTSCQPKDRKVRPADPAPKADLLKAPDVTPAIVKCEPLAGAGSPIFKPLDRQVENIDFAYLDKHDIEHIGDAINNEYAGDTIAMWLPFSRDKRPSVRNALFNGKFS